MRPLRLPASASSYVVLMAVACPLCLLVGITSCRKPTEESPAVAVEVQAAHPQVAPISEEITADATLAPLAQAALAPKISAPIRALYVQRGSHVRKGQLLVTLEDRDLRGSALDSQGSLLQAKAAFAAATQATIPEEVQKAQLDVDQARANLDVAERTAQERKRLLAEGAIAGRDTDLAIAAAVQAHAAYDMALKHAESVRNTIRSSGTESAQGQLTSAEGRYDSAQAQVSYANLRSPIRGIVTDRPFFAGETAPAGTPIVTVMDTTSLLAKLHLSQASAQKLTLGGEAEISVPGIDEPLKATVALISPALDPGSTTVEVWLQLRNADGKLKVGTPVHATITGDTVEKALQVPVAAVLPGQDGSSNVMVVGADGVAHKRSVKLGIRTPEAAQILSGLSPSDKVITDGAYGLDDGARVTVGAGQPSTGEKD